MAIHNIIKFLIEKNRYFNLRVISCSDHFSIIKVILMTPFNLTSSVLKPSSSRQSVSNLNSSQVRVEDWISSDMDPSKSKGNPPPSQHTNKPISADYSMSKSLSLHLYLYIFLYIFPALSALLFRYRQW